MGYIGAGCPVCLAEGTVTFSGSEIELAGADRSRICGADCRRGCGLTSPAGCCGWASVLYFFYSVTHIFSLSYLLFIIFLSSPHTL